MPGRPHLRRPPTATIVAFVALFVALGGTSFGSSAISAAKHLITGKQIKNGSITGKDIKNHSLKAKDFKAGQLPAGPRGPQGLQGLQGPKGDTGTVDTSNFYDKATADATFVNQANAQPYAWGQVRADASLRPVSSRVVRVDHPQTGLYCVVLTGSPQQSELEGSQVTLAGTSAQALFPHVTNGQGGDCAGETQATLAIRFDNSSGTLTDARFTFMVP